MRNKKRLAGKILKISPYKVKFADGALEDIQKAITRSDIRGLIAVHKITKKNESLHSRGGARQIAAQKKKGRQRNRGSHRGTKNSIVSRKDRWIARIRVQREFIKELRDNQLVTIQNYRLLYAKSKGGYFRSKRHIKLYLTEHHLVEKELETKK